MSSARHRLALFSALLLFTVSLAFAFSALVTDFWIKADKMNRNGTESTHSQMNSGLFHGVRQLDWEFGRPRREHFTVFDEIHLGQSFLKRDIWFAILLFLDVGLLWNIVGLFVALRIALNYGKSKTMKGKRVGEQQQQQSVLGTPGICLWSTLTAVSYGLSASLFVLQFVVLIKRNVLLPEHLISGFSSANCVELGFSFWLLIIAISAQIASCIFLFLTLLNRTECGANDDEATSTEVQQRENAFLY